MDNFPKNCGRPGGGVLKQFLLAVRLIKFYGFSTITANFTENGSENVYLAKNLKFGIFTSGAIKTRLEFMWPNFDRP